MAYLSVEYLKTKINEVLSSENRKICIVGIIGNCQLPNKDTICNHIVGKQAFKNETSKEENDKEGQHQFWQDKEHRTFAALLFIFSVCHIVLVSLPTPRFDLMYIKLFKLLASVRHNMLSHICSLLSGIDGMPEIWKTTGRPCIPRIIFVCQVPWSKSSTNSEPSLSRIQQSLQDQIHLILKKNRLLGSLSSSSLFTVSSPNPTFVYVQPSHNLFTDPVYWCINHLLKNSVNLDNAFRTISGKVNQSSLISQTPMSPGEDKIRPATKKNLSFQDFLNKQIDYMMSVESRDVPAEGRRGTHVEAPQDCLWYKVCFALFEFFFGNEDSVNNHIINMASSLDLDWKFSESRCRKVLPLATNAYLDNLPSHYTHSVHLSQLNQALHVFTLNARGPAFEHFIAQLQEDCNQIWWSGRQLCEIRSFTGQPCVYPFHRVPGSDELNDLDESAGIPSKPHSSRVTTVAACNCGRTQGTREDPFDLKVANYEFYKALEKKCCHYLVHFEIPTYYHDKTKQDQDNRKAATTIASSQEESSFIAKTNQTNGKVNGQDQGQIAALSSLALSNKDTVTLSDHSTVEATHHTGLSIGYPLTSELNEADVNNSIISSLQFESKTMADSQCSLLSGAVTTTVAVDGADEVKEELFTNVSRSEYIDAMLTEDAAMGALPAFPSWSLLCLGPASLYSPQKGIEQPGFFSGSNYLLPWDIRLGDAAVAIMQEEIVHGAKDSNEEQWPAPGEACKSTGPTITGPGAHMPVFQTVSKLRSLCKELEARDGKEGLGKGMVKKGAKDDKTKQSHVKAHIGNEYECPRGHRFICSAPDRVVKASGSGHLRDSAIKLVSCDMPLYYPCPCRSAKPQHRAQLSRAFIVTPDCHVSIRINPRVQPGVCESTPVFVLGMNDGVCLPRNSFCVLKFPYVYADESGPYLPPHDAHDLSNQKLLKGMYSIGV
eukprot:gene15308-16885_t